MIREWWAARKARYKAAELVANAEIARQRRIASIVSKPYKSAGEMMELKMLSEAIEPSMISRTDWLKADLQRLLDFSRGGQGMRFTDKTRPDGSDFPFFASEEEFARHRDLSRLVVGTNDNAKAMLGGLRRYTIGTGMTVRCVVKGHEEVYPPAQDIIDEFCRRNNMARKQREFFTRTSRDGEGILRLFDNGDGTVDVRFVWPEQIRQPPGTDFEEWSYGRQVDSEDVETTIAWAIFTDPTEYVEVPDEEIIYLGPNADSGVKRSLPDFCLGTGEVLEAANKLAVNTGECAAQQAAIAYIRQHAKATKETVQAFRNADADYTIPNLYKGTDEQVKHAMPGTIIDTNDETEFIASPFSAGMSAYVEVFQMLVRRVAARWNAPEWLGTSYSQEVNFASSLTAESPFVNTIRETQAVYAEAFQTLFERVLVIAAGADADGIPADVLDQIEVKVTFPNPQSRDALKEAQRAQIELTIGTSSPQQEAEQAGRDWQKVQDERDAAETAGWVAPGSMAPGQGMDEGGDGLDGGGDAGDSSGGGDTYEEWNENDHPRDDHGQFVDAGKMAAAKTNPKIAFQLRQEVTDPAERAKLDAAIGGGQGKHNLTLPKDRKALSHQHVEAALDQMGYKVEKKYFDLKAKTPITHLLHPDGSRSVVTGEQLSELIYQHHESGVDRSSKEQPEPPKAEPAPKAEPSTNGTAKKTEADKAEPDEHMARTKELQANQSSADDAHVTAVAEHVAKLSKLSKDKLHAHAKEAGIEGVYAGSTKAHILTRIQNHLTVGARAQNRARV